MKKYSIVKSRMRYVVSFEYSMRDRTFEEICDLVDKQSDFPYSFLTQISEYVKGSWKRVSLKNGEQDIYDYIVHEFEYSDTGAEHGTLSEEIGKAGCFWTYQTQADSICDLLYMPKTGELYPFSISQMGLYLFRSQIGLLWYEISFPEEVTFDSTELIHFQNKFKELNIGYSTHFFWKTDNLALPDGWNIEMLPFCMGNWISERLQFLNVVFQAERKNSYAAALRNTCLKNNILKLEELLPPKSPDKALIFSYVVFSQGRNWKAEHDEVQIAYYLTNGYKESYQMSDHIWQMIRQPFSNVIWLATNQGCGYYAWQDNSNSIFFSENQYEKIMNDYFLLYIKVLYQSYSLMHYSVVIAKTLSFDYKKYLEATADTAALLSEIRMKLNLFLVKSMTTSVSHIHHQNDFYIYLKEQLHINEDVESVTAGLAALDELQKQSVQQKLELERKQEAVNKEIEEEREKRADNMFQIGLGLMTFLATISAITDAYGIVNGLYFNEVSGGAMIVYWIIFALCIIILLTSLTIFIKSVKNLQKRNKQ